ncbi:uncharacterized protein TrAtP1_007474 [Trichoderma atroviride]|uniref:uncharacterized protein n=1 Tax=Hypocrea atroviridis TaxID=63577 RepID=UPI00332A25E5|nr:hypothetical protein TrAtP1_007474 [Trichoderma atroviride]
MVNIPGSSKSCKECKARRVKCGLEQPNCTRCVKSGMKCSGPRTGSIFIHRDVNNIQGLSDRKLLNNAIQSPNNKLSTQSKNSAEGFYTNDRSNKNTTRHPITASLGCSMDLYRSVIADLWTATYASNSNSPEQSGSPLSTSSRAILPLAFRNKALDTALFSVSAMYVGKLRGDSKLQDLALAAYPQAMGRFRSELAFVLNSETCQTSQKVLAIAISLSLLFFEWLANGEDGEGYRFHLDGALELIKHSGSEALESSVVRAAYVDLQTTALGQSLKFRKETFLVSGHWLALTRRLSTQDYRQSLLDIIAYIPGLLEQGEQMKLLASSLSKNTEYQDLPDYLSFPNVKKRQILDYFQDCDSLIHKLHLWLKSVENAEGGRLWWHSVTTLGDEYLQQRNLTSGRHHLPRIHFSNNRIPGIIVYYWSGLLELSATVLDIRQLFVHNTLYAALLDLLDADSPCLSMDLDTPNQLAVLICETVIHLSSSLEGCTMSHIPATLAEKYFIRLLSDSCRSHLEDDIACSKDYETACMGLDLCMKGQEIIRSTLNR